VLEENRLQWEGFVTKLSVTGSHFSLYKQSLLPYTFSHTTDSALSKCNDINHTVSAATGM